MNGPPDRRKQKLRVLWSPLKAHRGKELARYEERLAKGASSSLARAL